MSDSPLRLLNLASGRSIDLKPSTPHLLEKKVRVTAADDQGNVMVERVTDGAYRLDVDGLPVFEIAHVRPRQILQTDQAAYVVLRAADVFVRPIGDAEARIDRRARLAQKARVPLAAPVAAPGEGARPKRAPIWLLPAVLGGMVAAVGLATWTPTRQEPIDLVPAPPEKATIEPPVTPAAPLPSPAPEIKAETPVPPVVAARSAARQEEPAPRPDPAKQVSVAKVDPARERAVRQKLDGLLLEANYDPHKARAELRKLQATLPASSTLHKEVGQAAASIP